MRQLDACWRSEYAGLCDFPVPHALRPPHLGIHYRNYPAREWETLRVRFSDAFSMYNGLTEFRDTYEVVFTQAARFTDSDGVFPAQDAWEQIVERQHMKNRGEA